VVLRRLTVAACVAAALSLVLGGMVAEPRVGRPVAVVGENAQPGARDWIGEPATGRAIEVYASATDALPGDRVAIHVSTEPAAAYRVLVYRLGWYGGTGARLVTCLPSCDGVDAGQPRPVPAPDDAGRVGAAWPATDELGVGASWVSGYYLLRAVLLSGPQTGRDATTYVIVRERRERSRVLVQVPVNTWQAYNGWGGKSLYSMSSTDGRRARLVSFDRPYAWSLPGGQGPRGWELPLVRFLERYGYDVSYQSDVETDKRPESLLRHRLVIVAGHDEYWSRRMRDAFERARDGGVDLAFMGSNAAYWQVQMEDDGRSMLAWKSSDDPNPDPLGKTTLFRELVPPRYECALIGVQHQGGRMLWDAGDYTVAPDAAGDPWLAGTGLRAGDVLRGLVSVESDTVPASQTSWSSCGNELTVFFRRDLGGDSRGDAVASRYSAPSGAVVFASGSLQFAWALDDFADDPEEGHGCADVRVQRFVQNALISMGALPAVSVRPAGWPRAGGRRGRP
jgi:hypothetical protein